jgi:hypothetical protein
MPLRGHAVLADEYLLSGVKRTSRFTDKMSAFDPQPKASVFAVMHSLSDGGEAARP